MSAKQQHPYHLVDPSAWPILASIGLLLAPTGGVLSMHGNTMVGLPVLGFGTAIILYVMYGWWRDVIREGKYDKAHTPAVQTGLRIGMLLFIASEVMFFFAFFFAFFKAAIGPPDIMDGLWPVAEGVWPPEGIKTFDPFDLPFTNTLILLLSGTTVTWAHHALLHNDRKGLINGLACTVALGVIFSCFQAWEYSHAAFGFTDGKYASVFYMATGFHGFHVMIGTLFLAICLIRAIRGEMSEKHHLGFEFAAWYWHFVDVVWLFLFVFVYWWGA